MTGGIDGGTAHEVFAAGDCEAKLGFGGIKDAERLGHDFWADAVSGENGDSVTA
jgi:hypothetical protein